MSHSVSGQVDTDVLVIGGGAAACRAAVEASMSGARVVQVVKGRLGAIGTRGAGATSSGTSFGGGMASPGNPGGPSRDEDFANIVQAGLGMADRRLARVLVEEALESRRALESWGIRFEGVWVRGHGIPIVAALERIIRSRDITVLENTMMVRLLVKNGACAGAMGVNATGEIVAVRAGATVLATGGNANLFMLNMHPPDVTGDGYAMGYEAGAELVNMEFMQLFTTVIHPTVNLFGVLSARGAWDHPRFFNAGGEEFLGRYLPDGATIEDCLKEHRRHNAFSTRDRLSRYVHLSVIGEVRAGKGTERGGVFMEFAGPSVVISPEAEDWYRYRGLDLSRGRLEIGCCHHCSNGGLRINENAETTVAGLYAAGEVAGGPHGCDRMGGHHIAAGQVFGARAGKSAAATAKGRDLASFDKETVDEHVRDIADAGRPGGRHKPLELRKQLQRAAWETLLAPRDSRGIRGFLGTTERMREDSKDTKTEHGWESIEALELRNLLMVGEIVARAALARDESRGGHFRADFPERDDARWLKGLIVKKAGSGMHLGNVLIDPDWKERAGDLGELCWG